MQASIQSTNSNAIIEKNTTTPDVFDALVAYDLVKRYQKITSDSKGKWGKMNSGQMLKHVADNAEMEFGDTYLKRRFIGRIIGRLVINQITKNDKPNDKNQPTHPKMVITGEVDFNKEKERVLKLVARLATVDSTEFEGRVHPFFGKMKSKEWSIWIYKHLDHHLRQFGV